jgi:type IV pilus assembly protein PilO
MKLPFDLKKITGLKKKWKLVIMGATCVLLFAGLFMLLLMPKLEEKKLVEAEQLKAQQELRRLNSIKNNMVKTRQEYVEVKDRLNDMLRQMPEQKDVPNLLRQVSTLSHETGTRIRYFEPKAVQAKEFYSEMPFELRYSGGYHNMGYFFDGVRRLERIVHVTSFTLEAKTVGPTKIMLEGNCLAKTYVYVPGQQKPKEAKKK